ncbi:globin domain-containing protein [Candidatus Leptofilum sp.]|uniref:globin domain-containing protein n=1 Tax=Candidatus Leptofilum sp. TaxID=3241576 RepID=UPI003B5A8364
MQLHQIHLVQATFALVEKKADLFVTRLYDQLFRLDPCLCYLFPREIDAHKQKFMAVLAEIVAGLERPYPLTQQLLKPLGQAHAQINIQPTHYHTFANALCLALVETVGDPFTPEAEQAWRDAYYLVVGVMRETRS